VHTLDGCKFTLNGSSQIAIEKLEQEALVLSRGGQTIRIPWSEVVAIQFPTR
jgi:sporulation protein YlmC with PRC-barrel domain